jgi:hypothetical protein
LLILFLKILYNGIIQTCVGARIRGIDIIHAFLKRVHHEQRPMGVEKIHWKEKSIFQKNVLIFPPHLSAPPGNLGLVQFLIFLKQLGEEMCGVAMY